MASAVHGQKNKAWSTKEQVLKDLAKASGRRIKNEELDEGFLLIGNAPPPVMMEDEDAEMQLLFNGVKPTYEESTPDLKGIQQMLKMVEDLDFAGDEITNDVPNPADCVIAISKVSTLNPNVQEFVPKSITTPSQSTNINNTSLSKTVSHNSSNNENIVTQTVKKEETTKKEAEVCKNNDLDLDVDKHCTKANKSQDIATKLKNKISVAAKSDSFDDKKEKNVAIATLLRLYASNTPPETNTSEIKLIKPEFFEKAGQIRDIPTTSSSCTTSSSPEPKTSSTLPTCSSYSLSSTQTLSENNILTSKKRTPDPEIKRSIEKVNKWLGEPTKRKSPAVCLGPIPFKRKDPASTCKSPINDSDEKVSKPTNSGQKYQPSNYAADLGRKYMERSKVQEEKKNEVTWSNLEEVLKQKDLMIKSKLKENADTSDSNDESSSTRR